MTDAAVRGLIRGAEQASPGERWLLLCFLAGRAVELDEAERRAALRRAELLLAAGGDPRRPLELDGRAVRALAADLDTPSARAALQAGLAGLAPEVEGLSGAAEALRLLADDGELAWRCFACALLAGELADD